MDYGSWTTTSSSDDSFLSPEGISKHFFVVILRILLQLLLTSYHIQSLELVSGLSMLGFVFIQPPPTATQTLTSTYNVQDNYSGRCPLLFLDTRWIYPQVCGMCVSVRLKFN